MHNFDAPCNFHTCQQHLKTTIATISSQSISFPTMEMVNATILQHPTWFACKRFVKLLKQQQNLCEFSFLIFDVHFLDKRKRSRIATEQTLQLNEKTFTIIPTTIQRPCSLTLQVAQNKSREMTEFKEGNNAKQCDVLRNHGKWAKTFCHWSIFTETTLLATFGRTSSHSSCKLVVSFDLIDWMLKQEKISHSATN